MLIASCSASAPPRESTFQQRLDLLILSSEVTNAVQGTAVVGQTMCPTGVLLVDAPNGHEPPRIRVVRACDDRKHRHDERAVDEVRAACAKQVEQGQAVAWALAESVREPKPEGSKAEATLCIRFVHRGGYVARAIYHYRTGLGRTVELVEEIKGMTEDEGADAKRGDQPRQPTPGERLCSSQAPSARPGCPQR